MLRVKLMQHLLHIMEDLIVTFVTIQWEILYAHKTYISTAINGRRKNFSYFFVPPLSFFKLQHWQQYVYTDFISPYQ